MINGIGAPKGIIIVKFWSTYAIAITHNKSLFFEKNLFLYFGNIYSSLAAFCTPDKTCNVFFISLHLFILNQINEQLCLFPMAFFKPKFVSAPKDDVVNFT